MIELLCNPIPYRTQRLIFLIRDWSKPYQFDYGMDGGTRYLHHVMNKQGAMSKPVMERLSNSFETIDCCLLPYPGQAVATSTDPSSLRLGGKSQAAP